MSEATAHATLSKNGTGRRILVGAMAGSVNTLVTAFVGVVLTAIAVRSLPKELSGVYFLCLNFFYLLDDLRQAIKTEREKNIQPRLGSKTAMKSR